MAKATLWHTPCFVGPCPHKDMDYLIAFKFCNFYLIKTSFTLGEHVYLIEMFRLFKWKWIFWCSECEQNCGTGQQDLGFGGQWGLGFKRSYGNCSCCCKDVALSFSQTTSCCRDSILFFKLLLWATRNLNAKSFDTNKEKKVEK